MKLSARKNGSPVAPDGSAMTYSNFAVPRATFESGYRELVAIAASGGVELPIQQFAIDDAAAAWGVAASGEAKAVVMFDGARQ